VEDIRHWQDLPNLDSLPQKSQDAKIGWTQVGEKRPKAVLVVVAFLLFATGMAAAVGTALLFPGSRWEWLWNLNRAAYEQFQVIGRSAGVFLYAVGLATAAAATGLLRGRKWSWWMALAVFAVNCLGDIVSLFVTGEWVKSAVGVVVSGSFVAALISGSVRDYVSAANSPSTNRRPPESIRR
jgi:hypothetical protein